MNKGIKSYLSFLGLFMEAVAVGEMGIVVAARLNCDYNEDLEDPDETSYLFYMDMLPTS